MTDPLAPLRAQRLILLDALRKAKTHTEKCRLQDELNDIERQMRGESDEPADE
jgi:hypothetical protein